MIVKIKGIGLHSTSTICLLNGRKSTTDSQVADNIFIQLTGEKIPAEQARTSPTYENHVHHRIKERTFDANQFCFHHDVCAGLVKKKLREDKTKSFFHKMPD